MAELEPKREQPQKKRWGLSAALSLLITCSLLANQTLYLYQPGDGTILAYVLGVFRADPVVSLILLCFSFRIVRTGLCPARPFSRGTAVTSGILALFSVIGDAMSSVAGGTLDWLTAGWAPVLLAALVLLGRAALLCGCLTILFRCLDRRQEAPIAPPSGGVLRFVFDTHYRLCIPAVLVLCWSVYYIALFPGYVGYDIQAQLDCFYRNTMFTAHHPAASTLLNGVIFEIGRRLISDNAGCFLAIAFQSAALILAITCIFGRMRRYRSPYPLRVAVLLFFALLTVWPFWADTWDKDILYTAVFLLFYLELLNWTEHSGNLWMLIGLSGLLCLLRNNGNLIWAASVIPLWCLAAKAERRTVARAAIGVVCVLVLSTASQRLVRIRKGGVQEMLSVPFQQTARSVLEHGDDLTEADWERLNRVFSDSETLGGEYRWWYSDPVKNHYRFAWGDATTDEDQPGALLSYAKCWLELLFRYPLTYFEAAFAHTYIYYDFDSMGTNINYDVIVPNKHYALSRVSTCDSLLKLVYGVRDVLTAAPGIRLLYNPGLYAWIVIAGLTYLLGRGRKAGLAAAAPLLMNVLICILSPVNGNIRYALPLMGCVPVFLAFVWKGEAGKPAPQHSIAAMEEKKCQELQS